MMEKYYESSIQLTRDKWILKLENVMAHYLHGPIEVKALYGNYHFKIGNEKVAAALNQQKFFISPSGNYPPGGQVIFQMK